MWDRENEFADAVARHDAATFAEHVLPGAVFAGGGELLRGREAIVKAWGQVIRGEAGVFVWHPTSVDVTGDPHVALSRGPYWIEKKAADGTSTFVTGTFQSTWVKDVDGVWRVAIDGDTPPPHPATRAEIDALVASIPPSCPPLPR